MQFLGKNEKCLPPQSLNEVEVGKFMELYKSLEHFDVEIIPTRKEQPHTQEKWLLSAKKHRLLVFKKVDC